MPSYGGRPRSGTKRSCLQLSRLDRVTPTLADELVPAVCGGVGLHNALSARALAGAMPLACFAARLGSKGFRKVGMRRLAVPCD